MKKRNTLRVPVTHGLKDIYSMDMRTAYQAACLNQFNVILFSRLAAAISVVRTALVQHNTLIENAVDALDSAIAVLQRVRQKGDNTGVWEIEKPDQAAVLSGIEIAEQCIGTLDVALLAETAERLMQEIDV